MNEKRRSRLAVSSFVWSLMPVIIPAAVVFMALFFEDFRNDVGVDNFFSFFGTIIYYGFFIITIWSSPLSIVLGVKALFKIKKDNLKGKWFAVAGIAISLMTLAFFGFLSSWGTSS